MIRRQAREVALKALFAVDVGRVAAQRILDDVLEEARLPERAAHFARGLVEGTLTHRSEIDAHIARHAVGWTLDRMASVDRNILRLAIHEILHRPDIPPSVSVNEAVELAKAYGDAASPKFVNGILGQIIRHLALVAGPPPD